MTIPANRPTLLVTISLSKDPSREFLRHAASFRAELGTHCHLTWLSAAVDQALDAGLPSQDDEVGLISPSSIADRQAVAVAMRAAALQLAKHARQLNTITDGEGAIWPHADLLVKGGCSAVLQTAPTTKTARRLRSNQPASDPRRGRFGLWIVPAKRTVSTKRDLAQAARIVDADLQDGLAHLAISADAENSVHQGLSALGRELAALTKSKQAVFLTVRDLAQSFTAQSRSKPAQSILRKAA